MGFGFEKYGLNQFNKPNQAVFEAWKKILFETHSVPDIDQHRRKDLRHLVAYAIDTDAVEVDDAISWDTTSSRIYVHIADLTRFFPDPTTDPILNLVMRRTQTIYSETMNFSMFPKKLVQEKLSLDGSLFCGEVLTVSFQISSDGTVDEESTRIEPAYISRPVFMNYDDARSSILGGTDGCSRDIRCLYQKGAIRRRSRAKSSDLVRTADFLPLGEGNFINCEAMVAELMVTANHITADYCKRHDIPVIFKHQHWGYPSSVRQPVGDSTKPFGHASMGLGSYTQMTSPLRRSADILTHLQIKAHSRSEPLPLSEKCVAGYVWETKRVKENITKWLTHRGGGFGGDRYQRTPSPVQNNARRTTFGSRRKPLSPLAPSF